jgi:DNA-directed RNA polymerase subunit K/omega
LNQRPGAVEEAARLSVVNAHWGIASDLPIIGPILVLARRAARLALRWYINPIVEQQNAFNEAVVRALYELETENYELRSKIAQPEIREH